MKLVRNSILLLALALLLTGCGREPVSEPPVPDTGLDLASARIDAEVTAGEIMAASGWEFDPEVPVPDRVSDIDTKCFGHLIDFSREMLAGDVAHYTFLLQIGPGEFDRIKVHRVVKERRPFQPIRTRHAIFLQHGDAVGFVKFLYGQAAPSVPDDHAAAIYLAQHDIDVWGIDQNWVLVPEETAGFGFMQDWGMDNQIENLHTGLAVARYTRLFTGNGFRKMHLLGYSSGGWLGFAYLNAEATIPYGHRHVKGYVNADALYKYGPDDEAGRQLNCDDAAYFVEERASGVYEWWVGFAEVGELALSDPDGDSPIFEGFTNQEVGLYFGCAGWRDYPLNPWWHYWGGVFDGDPEDPETMPIDTRFLPKEWSFEFMATAASWQSNAFFLDYNLISCDEEDVPWDDHLAEINVPVLNLGGAGALAPSALHTLGLLGSTDVQHVIVQMLPDDQKFEDFGHIDIWTATEAPELVWAPLLDWITSHNGRGVGDDDYPLVIGME